MRISLASCLIVFCRCAGSPPPIVSHRVDVPWPVKSSKRPAVPLRLASDPQDTDFGLPRAALQNGAKVKNDALGYVLAPHSKAETIDRLAELSRAYDAAKLTMDENFRVRGYYSKGDVEAFQRAVEQLNAALREKDKAE